MGEGQGTHVEGVVEEYHEDHSATESRVFLAADFVPSGEDGPDDECKGHADGADQHDSAAAKVIDEEGKNGVDDEGPCPETAVNPELIVGICDADVLKDNTHVIAD